MSSSEALQRGSADVSNLDPGGPTNPIFVTAFGTPLTAARITPRGAHVEAGRRAGSRRGEGQRDSRGELRAGDRDPPPLASKATASSQRQEHPHRRTYLRYHFAPR